VVGKSINSIRVVTNGAGAAGVAIIKLLMSMGVKDVIMCDTKGTIYTGRPVGMNKSKDEIAKVTNPQRVIGSLADALVGADVFIGVSAANMVTPEMVKTMANDPIMPELAKEAGAKVVGTGRSDFPNQVNNVSAFPGIFRGALDVRASQINEEMKIAAAYAIASLVGDEERTADYVIPLAFDPRVAPAVAAAVAQAAMDSGVARITVDPEYISNKVWAIRSE